MKLISCYVENFGGLSRYALDFEEGLTVIQAPNGFGKTTLAEFIRAMFYGFPRKTSRVLGRREKYTPWNGGPCRGHLTFEFEGCRYRIERSFGARPQQDTFRLVDLGTGKVSRRFSRDIGLELFGLDAESFERSTYLPQNRDPAVLATDSIRAKLSDLVEDTGDVGNYEKAVKALQDKRRTYEHENGRGGAVKEAADRITRLQEELDAAQTSARRLRAVTERIGALEEEQARGTAELEVVRQALAAANQAAHYQYYRQQAGELEGANARLAALEEKYPRGFPDTRELLAAADGVDRAARLAGEPAVTPEDRRAEEILAEHRDRFAAGVPDEADLDAMQGCWDDRRTLTARLEACAFPEEEAAELAALREFFAPGLPGEETLRRQEAAGEEARRLRQENLRRAEQTAAMPAHKVPSPLTVPLLLGCGGLGLLAGVWLLVQRQPIPGAVLAVLGLAALAGAWYLSRRSAARVQVPALSPREQAVIRENAARAAELERALAAFTAVYGHQPPAEIRRRAERLEKLADRERSLSEKRRTLEKQREKCDGTLAEFFETFRMDPAADPGRALNRLRRICADWNRAQAQLRERDRRLARRGAEEAAVRGILDGFREKYGLALRDRDQILALRDDIRLARELEDSIRNLETRLAQLRQEHGAALDAPPAAVREEPEVLRRREKALLVRQEALTAELLGLRQEARECRAAAGRVPELQEDIAQWQARRAADQERARLLKDTALFLEKARENLATAYMGPIRQRFAALMERMAGVTKEEILITESLEVRLERAGAGRELAFFSAGQTDMILLCMRLALVDALFRDARPFVILDDPFVNLDDDSTRKALALLEELSRDRQILYLVCNSSRARPV